MDIRDKRGWTALMFAVREGYTDIMDQLLESGADTEVFIS